MRKEKDNGIYDEVMKYLPKWQRWLWNILKAMEEKKKGNGSKTSFTNVKDAI